MDSEQVKSFIEAGIKDCEAIVEGSGSNYQLTVISQAFADLTPVKKQQLVYACLNEQIKDGSIHAVTMQLHTPEEWAKAKRFM